MTERSKNLELAKASLNRLSGIWMKFPDFTHPDIEDFTSRLEVGHTPAKIHYPPFFPGLKPDYVKLINDKNNSYKVPEDTFTDFETGTTFLSDRFFNQPQIVLDGILAYQVGLTTFMETHKTSGVELDEEERKTTEEYLDFLCTSKPRLEDLSLVKNGFMRTIFHINGTPQPEFVAFLPPRGGIHDPEVYHVLNLIYPQAFAQLTNSVLLRNGDMDKFMADLKSGHFLKNDFNGDTPQFNANFYLMSHYMGDNPWAILDAMLTKDTVEAERRLQGAVSGGSPLNLLRLLSESLVSDEQLMSHIRTLADEEEFRRAYSNFYRKGRIQ